MAGVTAWIRAYNCYIPVNIESGVSALVNKIVSAIPEIFLSSDNLGHPDRYTQPMSTPQFEPFKRSSARIVSAPMMSVQRHGTMSLNQASFEALGKPDAVLLMFDRQQQIVGLKLAEDSNPDAYTVQKQPTGNSYIINTQSFYKFWKIDVSVARRFGAIEYGHGVVGINLQEGRVVVSGRNKTAEMVTEIVREQSLAPARDPVPGLGETSGE